MGNQFVPVHRRWIRSGTRATGANRAILCDLLSPSLANATRQQLAHLQPMIADLGVLQSVTFKGVGPGGADIYACKFENGSLDFRVWGGQVDSANVRPGEE